VLLAVSPEVTAGHDQPQQVHSRPYAKGLKDRCVLVEMNAASTGRLLPIARKVAADLNVVLNDTELTTEIAAFNGSMREVMSRVKRLARRKQSASPP
jgi:hypothetical protein